MVDIIPQISADEVKSVLDHGEELILLDVRTPGELQRGKIPQAINIPVDQIGHMVEQLIPNKNTKVIAYCLSGTRSDNAVETMKNLGYLNVFSMTNGLLLWRIKKYPIE